MKNFKELREKFNNNLHEKKDLNYVVKDMKSAEFLKNELSSLVKADFKINRKGSKYEINIIPKSTQDEKVVRSFMDDAKIELLKDNFVIGMRKSIELGENVEIQTLQGDGITLEPSLSSKIVEIHDCLHRENQEIFMEMLVHSTETFEQIKDFCESYSTNKG